MFRRKNLGKRVELSSPVGSFETLQSAIQGGADSVYLGIGNLNLRAKASNNFTIKDLPKIVERCRHNNVKLYVTVNSIIYDEELEEVKRLLHVLSQSQVDAVIAMDMSVIMLGRQFGIPIHASTQLNISNIEAVKFFSNYCDTLILARELNLKQISNIVNQIKQVDIKGPSGHLVKIEVFIHGALCMAIAGKCFLSLDNHNFSANRGVCLQVCRRSYTLYDKMRDIELFVDNNFILSPKDLCTIEFIDKIIESGVDILKIEGRARAPEYVKTVTEVYKEAINLYYQGQFNKEVALELKKKLSTVYNRGFWEGYYLGKKTAELAESAGSVATVKKEYIGKITHYFSKIKVAEITIETGCLKINDKILIIGPTTGVEEIIVEEIRVNYENVQQSIKGEKCSIPVKNLVRTNDKVYKLIENTNTSG